MNPLKILTKLEKKQIQDKLKKQFGITEIPGILLQSGTERIFLYQGSLTEKQIKSLEESRINIERIGIYFAKEQGSEIRLSTDGIHILRDQITKNILELNKEQLNEWMHGQELNIKTDSRGFIIIKHKEDYIGCGKASENKITNFMPKSRRLKV